MAKPQRSSQPPLDPVDKTVVRDVLHEMGTDAAADRVVDQLAHAGVNASADRVELVKQAVGSAARNPSAKHDEEWRRHEHVAEAANAPAQELLDRAGSPELAKHAIDAVAQRAEKASGNQPARETDAAGAGEPQQRLATELGFASYGKLLEGSTPVSPVRYPAWFATRKDREWVVWNAHEFKIRERFSSKDEAVASLTELGKP